MEYPTIEYKHEKLLISMKTLDNPKLIVLA